MKTDKTDIFFNEMYKEISKTELHYDFKVKEVLNNKHLDNEEVNKKISLINLEKEDAIRDIKVEHTSNAINEGYDLTYSTALDNLLYNYENDSQNIIVYKVLKSYQFKCYDKCYYERNFR